jgi:transposase
VISYGIDMNHEDLVRESVELARRQTELQGRKEAARPFLEGEDPGTMHRDDAVHWTTVYGELIGFKRELLGQLEDAMHNADRAVADELEHDRTLLSVELQRLELHHRFWRERVAPPPDPGG